MLSLACWVFSTNSKHNSASPSSPLAASSVAPFWPEDDLSASSGSTADGPVYPYSVIPGGVTSAKSLGKALVRDRVVAAHYQDFRARSARIIRLAKERQVYVSYRIGDRILWTKKKVTLHAGETVLTDGVHLVRTRCGNRISEVPEEPTLPADPAAQVLNTPVVPQYPPAMTTNILPAAPLWSDNSAPLFLALGNTPLTNVPGSGTPFFPPGTIPACCGSSPHSPGSVAPPASPLPQPGPGPGPTAPPISTSEPCSIVLLTVGLAGLLFLLKFRRS